MIVPQGYTIAALEPPAGVRNKRKATVNQILDLKILRKYCNKVLLNTNKTKTLEYYSRFYF